MPAPLLEQHDRPPADARAGADSTLSSPRVWGLALVGFAAAMLLILGVSIAVPERPASGAVQVYRVDWQSTDGSWQPWTWGITAPPHPATQKQTDTRACRRRSATHTCQTMTAARFDTAQAARAYRQQACRTHTDRTGLPPAGMPTCG